MGKKANDRHPNSGVEVSTENYDSFQKMNTEIKIKLLNMLCHSRRYQHAH